MSVTLSFRNADVKPELAGKLTSKCEVTNLVGYRLQSAGLSAVLTLDRGRAVIDRATYTGLVVTDDQLAVLKTSDPWLRDCVDLVTT